MTYTWTPGLYRVRWVSRDLKDTPCGRREQDRTGPATDIIFQVEDQT